MPELQRCWRHSLATAVLAEELARVASLRPDQAYTAGLLHDLGRLALLAACPGRYTNLLRWMETDGPKDDSSYLLEYERQHFEIDHCEAGLALGRRWGLPDELCMIAGHHHEAVDIEEFDVANVARLSCALADTLGFGVVTVTKPLSRAGLPVLAGKRAAPILDRPQGVDAAHPREDRLH